MRDLPTERLDIRVKRVWRINDGIWITVCMFCVICVALIMMTFSEMTKVATTVLLAAIAVYGVLLIIWLVILPPIRYARWYYRICPDYLEIVEGIIWRKHYIIPFIRVQNTDTRQGPLLRLFGLASVTVATAAGNHEVPGLSQDTAERLRDKAAELARLAREDV